MSTPTSPIAAPELKTCPFCGSDPLLQEIEPHTHAGGIAGFMPDHPGSFTIECVNGDTCCAMIANTLDEVVTAWNHRASIEQPTSARDAALEEAAVVCNLLAKNQALFHQHAEMYVADFLARKIREMKSAPPAVPPPEPVGAPVDERAAAKDHMAKTGKNGAAMVSWTLSDAFCEGWLARAALQQPGLAEKEKP